MQLLRVARRMMFDIRLETSELYVFLRNLIRRIDKQIAEVNIIHWGYQRLATDLKQTCGTIDPELTYADLWAAEPFMSRNLVPKQQFSTPRDAYDAFIHILEEFYNDPQPDHQSYLDRIRDWQVPFEEFKKADAVDKVYQAKIPGLEVFRRHYEMVIMKSRDAPVAQTWWDQHETILNETIDFLQLDPDMNQGTSFGLEHCFVYQLFNIGRNCRSPTVRRRVIKWMESVNVQEGVLSGELVVKALGKVLEVEEAGLHIQKSSEIPEDRRIQEVELEFSDDTSKMKYRVENEWRVEILF